MTSRPFGNDPGKVDRYLAFWQRSPVRRPLVGFTLRGWFPLQEYAASRDWPVGSELTPGSINPREFLHDEERLLEEGEKFDDDILRGASPASAIVPWLEAILGARLRVLPGSVLAMETETPWEAVQGIVMDRSSPWYEKYLEFARILGDFAAGRFPVSHSALSGPADLMATFRGQTQSIFDLYEEPDLAARFLSNLSAEFKEITISLWNHLPLFHGGYFDSMYELWAPGPIIRMQEDACSLYSPALYRTFLQHIDRELAKSFSNAFIHLHSTSLPFLELFLEIEDLRCFEINLDVSGPAMSVMVPAFQKVQSARRSLIIRGSFTADDLILLRDSLDAKGLMVLILVESTKQVEQLRKHVGL